MVRKTFYQKLRSIKNRFTWKLEFGAIRGYPKQKKAREAVPDGFCPLTAVDWALNGHLNNVEDFDVSAKNLGVKIDDARFIVEISDDEPLFCDSGRLIARKNLLKSVGLKEDNDD